MGAIRAFGGPRGEGGQAIVLVAIFMLGMLFAVGLAIDAGQLFNGRRTAQEAADAAAFAGAVVLYQGGSAAQARAAAADDAALNGYSANVPASGTTVTVSSPPTSGSFSGGATYVEVTIQTPVRTSLVPQQSGLTTVRARAVAGNVGGNSGYSLVALDQTCTAGDVALSSQGQIEIDGGGVLINSCSSSAGQNSGNLNIHSPYGTDVVGNVTGPGWNATPGHAVGADPFAGLARPSTNGLGTYTPSCSGTNQAGIYTTAFSSNCDYALAAGMYILKGGGISLAGNSSLTGSGVTLFLTNSNYPASGGTCATFALNGNNHTTLSPPASGTYAGMLIWQDSACTGTLSIGGNGQIDSTGTIYAPSATVAGNGNNAQVTCSQIVAKKFNAQNASFQITYTAGTTYQGKLPALVE